MNRYDRFIQEDQRYQNQILSNNNFDYYQAQTYYQRVKKAMLEQLATETQSQMMSNTIRTTIIDLESQIIQQAQSAALDSSEVMNQAKQALSELDNQIGGELNTLSLKKAITKAAKQAKESLTKEQSEYKNFSSTFTSKVRSLLSKSANDTIEKMLSSTSFYSGASNLVQANMRNYLLRNLINQSLIRNKSSIGLSALTTASSLKYPPIAWAYLFAAVVSALSPIEDLFRIKD